MKRLLIAMIIFYQSLANLSAQTDTLGKIIPDDFPIRNAMFKGNYGDKVSGEIISHDKVWFANDSLGQTLVFDLYTDYHRYCIYLFADNDIPDDLIQTMELHVKGGNLATPVQKAKFFKGLMDSSIKIKKSFFTTNKGFKLGSKKTKALAVYGKPDTSSTLNGIEKCEWYFLGDAGQEPGLPGIRTGDGKKLAAKSFGCRVLMYFRKGELIAMILFNDIP